MSKTDGCHRNYPINLEYEFWKKTLKPELKNSSSKPLKKAEIEKKFNQDVLKPFLEKVNLVEEALKNKARPFEHQAGLSFSNQSYTKYVELGSGAEGTAYLIENGSEKFVLKFFADKNSLISHVNLLKKFKQAGIPAAEVLGFESQTSILKLSYVEGLSWELLKQAARKLSGNDYLEGVKIVRKFENLAQQNHNYVLQQMESNPEWKNFQGVKYLLNLHHGNVIMQISEDGQSLQMVIIDIL